VSSAPTSAPSPRLAGHRPPAPPTYSIVIPVYGNEASIPHLLERLAALTGRLDGPLEVVLVVDGSPDGSLALLRRLLPAQPFAARLVAHSRNFGAFAAIRTGLERSTGRYMGVMAADLQEPPELMLDFFAVLARDEADVVVGTRRSREDPGRSATASRLFWRLYRRLVQRDMPEGGIDVFGCTAVFRDHLVALGESHSSLVGLTLWLGFRRAEVPYDRLAREHGVSAWTLRKKLKYLSDSIFSFTDLPIRLLLAVGVVGMIASVVLATVVGLTRLTGAIEVPGYAATIMVIAFFGALNLFGLGIIGAYVWRGFENTKQRPGAVVMAEQDWPGAEDA
jgi:glycosyltransferase involved in cell wall biosynthesis